MSAFSRRAFIASSVATVFSPNVISAQSLGHNDIWTKYPKRELHSAVSLCLDSSGSMSAEELSIQGHGTANALQTDLVRSIIKYHNTQTDRSGVALCLIDFAQSAQVKSAGVGLHNNDVHAGNWAVLETDADIEQFADFIRLAAPTTGNRGTNIVGALEKTHAMHASLPYSTAKRVCDVSTDGHQSFSKYGVNANPDKYPWELSETVEMLAQSGIVTNVFSMTDNHQDLPAIKNPDGTYNYGISLVDYHKRFLQTPQKFPELDYAGGFTISVSKKSANFKHVYRDNMAKKMFMEFT